MSATSFYLLAFLMMHGNEVPQAKIYPTASIEECQTVLKELSVLLQENLTVIDFALQCVRVDLATFRKDRS